MRLAGDALDQCRRRVQQELHGHRGQAGAHTVAHGDWEAGLYVPTLFGVPDPVNKLRELGQ